MKNTTKTITAQSNRVRRQIGKNIKALRKQNDLSQMGLGSEASIELSTVHRIEAAKTDTTLSTLSRIREAFGVSWGKLLEGV
jgi:transcriptional regulator with XRE-family HTH domain